MLDRDRGHNAQVGGLTLGLALLGLYALLAISVSWVNSTHVLQGQAEQHAGTQCQEGKDCDEKALRLQARELVTAEATFDLAVYQSIFNFVGVLGLGVTVFYAHRAWREAQRSADAAHHSLDDARRNAGEQAARFEAQLVTAAKTAEATARSAEAMIAAERAYVFFLDTEDAGVTFYPAYRVIWQNFGKTPAFVTGVRLGFFLADEPPGTAEPSRYEIPFGAIIGAGGAWPRGQVSTKAFVEAQKANPNEPHIAWLIGEISYRDIHGRDHRSWFCRRYTGKQFILDGDVDDALNGYN